MFETRKQKKKTSKYKEVKILLIQVFVDQSYVQYVTKMMTMGLDINSTQQMIQDCMFYIQRLGLNTHSWEMVNSAISVSYLSLTKTKITAIIAIDISTLTLNICISNKL